MASDDPIAHHLAEREDEKRKKNATLAEAVAWMDGEFTLGGARIAGELLIELLRHQQVQLHGDGHAGHSDDATRTRRLAALLPEVRAEICGEAATSHLDGLRCDYTSVHEALKHSGCTPAVLLRRLKHSHPTLAEAAREVARATGSTLDNALALLTNPDRGVELVCPIEQDGALVPKRHGVYIETPPGGPGYDKRPNRQAVMAVIRRDALSGYFLESLENTGLSWREWIKPLGEGEDRRLEMAAMHRVSMQGVVDLLVDCRISGHADWWPIPTNASRRLPTSDPRNGGLVVLSPTTTEPTASPDGNSQQLSKDEQVLATALGELEQRLGRQPTHREVLDHFVTGGDSTGHVTKHLAHSVKFGNGPAAVDQKMLGDRIRRLRKKPG